MVKKDSQIERASRALLAAAVAWLAVPDFAHAQDDSGATDDPTATAVEADTTRDAGAPPSRLPPPCRRIEGVSCLSKRLGAYRVPPGQEIRVDGQLDDAVWQRASFASDFVQREPNEGALPSVRTEVAFAYDRRALYVGARMFSDDPEKIRAVMTRRDNDGNSERLIVSIDGYQDRRTAYSFAVTAAGVRVDWYHSSDRAFSRDYSYDPVWKAASRIDSLGWTAEMEIPLSQLRFRAGDFQEWGININRYIPTKNEDIFWIAVPKDESGWASWFGDLTGIESVTARRPVEVMPYVATDATFTSAELVEEGNPFEDGSELKARAGLDVKAGLGPNLTLDATVNPDFGQVEADPAVVNLTAFEVFFPERRPFFIEGDRLLRGRGPGYYFSRRIGAAPGGSAGGDFVDAADLTRILSAAKMTGRLNSGLSVGVLGALTANEYATVADTALDETERVRVEPLAGWGVLRLQQEFGAAASAVGLSLTGVVRDVGASTEDPLAASLNREAVSGGADLNLRLRGGEYELSAYAGFSHVGGDTAAIRKVQESSARWYQRPDVDHVELDPTRTSLGGVTGSLRFERETGEHWLWAVRGSFRSPGFELNDIGRLNKADRVDVFGRLQYRENTPGSLFHRYSMRVALGSSWNFGWDRQSTFVDLNGEVTFKNFWGGFIGGGIFPRAQSDDLTRGGPSMGTGRGWNLFGGFSSDRRSRTSFGAHTFYDRNELGGWGVSLNGRLTWQPTAALELSLNPRWSRFLNVRQYVTTEPGGRPATFGERYVFATTDRRTVAMQVRLNYAITPHLSLEGYAEPFVQSGRFFAYGELEAARSRNLRIYGTDGTEIVKVPADEPGEPATMVVTDGDDTFSFSAGDFEALSYRTNFVVRWEYLPGSTLFFIWQQNRGAFEPVLDPEPANLGKWFDAISAPGQSFFAVKVTYWLAL